MDIARSSFMTKQVMEHFMTSLIDSYLHTVETFGRFAIQNYLNMLFNPQKTWTVPLDLAIRSTEFVHTLAAVPKPQWSTPNKIIYSSNFAHLRDFSIHPENKSLRPVLVVPPNAGQHSCIADYSPEQSQIQTIRQAGFNRVYSIDWLSACEDTKNLTVSDYIQFMRECIQKLGEPVNLIGDCQGGWQSVVYACLYPEDVNTLAIAGAPIDFEAGDGDVKSYINIIEKTIGMEFYYYMVKAQGGYMDGNTMRRGFLALKPENAFNRFVDLYVNVDDPNAVERFKTFEAWFTTAQHLPGKYYLWIVNELFLKNKLVKGELEVNGQKLDMKKIKCPVYLLGGAKDHITPPIQVHKMADYISTPEDKVMKLTNKGGHTGLFMGHEALKNEWTVITRDMISHSRKSK